MLADKDEVGVVGRQDEHADAHRREAIGETREHAHHLKVQRANDFEAAPSGLYTGTVRRFVLVADDRNLVGCPRHREQRM